MFVGRPAGRCMNQDESVFDEALDLPLGVRARDEADFALIHSGIDSDAAQRIQVELDFVPAAGDRVKMAEASAPEAPAMDERCDAVASAEHASEPGAAHLVA